MLLNATNMTATDSAVVTLRCPGCRQIGTFEGVQNVRDAVIQYGKDHYWVGQRRCPKLECRTHVFVVHDQNRKLLESYPPERIDFDPSNIPQRIATTLSEAVTCHAEDCHVAAAIMIRRCLEELCEEKQAKGATLKDRLQSLRSAVLLPVELFTALDELRLLGNDAAHLEARLYDSIGKDEIDIAMELTKEILKAVYQLDALVKKLQALKKP